MDVLVMLEDRPEHSTVLAHVSSAPSPLNSDRPARDVVTLFGDPTPERLAMALAVAVETHRGPFERSDAVRHVALWPERGAVGDAAWRDETSGDLISHDIAISNEVLSDTAGDLLHECGRSIRRLVAGLTMPDWPEGSHRAIRFSLAAHSLLPIGPLRDTVLDSYRQADGFGVDPEGD